MMPEATSWARAGHASDDFESVTIDYVAEDDTHPDVDALFGDPRLASTRELRVATWCPWTGYDANRPSSDYRPIIDALTKHPRPALAELAIDGDGGGDMQARSLVGDLSGIWTALPALRGLTVFGQVSGLGAARAAALRDLSLTLRASDVDGVRVIADVTRGSWPALETLTLRLWEGSTFDLSRLLAKKTFPALRHLTLDGFRGQVAIVEVLAADTLLPQLASLTLADATADDDAGALGAALRRHAPLFRKLESFSVDNDGLNDAACAQLRELLPRVNYSYGFPVVSAANASELFAARADLQELSIDRLELSVTTASALAAAGIERVRDLVRVGKARAVNEHGLRRRSARELGELLANMGLAF